MIDRKTFFALLMVPLLCLGVFAQEEFSDEAEQTPIPEKVKQELTMLLPDMAALGAEPAGKIEFYGSNLFEYINGGASVYHDYDFVAVVHRDYKKGETEITADIYFMDGKLNAFGIYSAERSPGYNFIKVGAEGYLEDSILNFLQGPYYVKLMAYSPKGKTNALLRDIANDISKRIGTGKKFPTALKRFPTDNLVARSEMYLNKAPLACEFLEPAFKANYMFGEKKSSLFISIAKNAKEARARVEKMKARVAKAGEVKTLSGLGKMAFSGKDKYIGEMIAFPKSRYAIFLINPPENPEAFLKKTAEGLTRKK